MGGVIPIGWQEEHGRRYPDLSIMLKMYVIPPSKSSILSSSCNFRLQWNRFLRNYTDLDNHLLCRTMTMELFELTSTYEVLLDIGQTIRPVRIEIFRSRENVRKLRARLWEQNTYNLYPTFANIQPEGGLENRLLSCDQVNTEISALVAEAPDILLGREWDSEEAFLQHMQESIMRYQSVRTKNA